MLRRWTPDDAELLAAAVSDSLEHLRPWMPWAANEPLRIAQRRSMLDEAEQRWRGGGDVMLGVFLDDGVAGSCGLHRRIGADGLELGYWIAGRHTRRGLATSVGALLTGAALGLPGITHVEIHHDRANVASAGVARRLGFELLAEVPEERHAPGEIGIECRWRMDGGRWAVLGATAV